MYSGDPEGLNAFLEQYDVVAAAHDWTEQEKCQKFPLYLRHFARDAYVKLAAADKIDYNLLVPAFQRSISTPDAGDYSGVSYVQENNCHTKVRGLSLLS